MPARGFSSESFKRTNWEKQHRAKCTHHPPVVGTDRQLNRLHNCAPDEDGATRAMGAGASAGPQYSRRSMHNHTWESFGPKLFIWFSLSATSVSSVHLCPRYKKKTSPTLLRKPPLKTTRPSGRCTDFSVTTNKMGAKLTQKDTFYPHPLFPPGRPRTENAPRFCTKK